MNGERAVKPVELMPASGGGWRSAAVNILTVVLVVCVALFLGGGLASGNTTLVIAVVGIAAVVTVAALAADAGLLLWMAAAPFGALFNLTMGRGLPDLSLSRIAALFLLVLLLSRVVTGSGRLVRLSAIEMAGAAFLVGMLMSLGASRLGLVGGVQNLFDSVVLPLLVFFFARNLLRTPRQRHWMLIVFAVVVGVMGVIAAREQLTNQPVLSPVPYRWEYGRHSVKVTSLFGSPAIMAATLAVPVPFLFMAALRARSLAARLVGFLGLAGAGAGLLLTYVRAGWLAAVLGLLVTVLFSRRARTYGLPVLLVLVSIAVVFGGDIFDARAIDERLQAANPINYRFEAMEVGLQIARDAPLFGVGLDNYSDAAISAGWRPLGGMGVPAVAPHNMFLYVLTSAGLVGLAPLLALFGFAVWQAYRVWRTPSPGSADWGAAALGMIVAYLLLANTFDALAAKTANLYFFVILGALLAVGEQEAAR